MSLAPGKPNSSLVLSFILLFVLILVSTLFEINQDMDEYEFHSEPNTCFRGWWAGRDGSGL